MLYTALVDNETLREKLNVKLEGPSVRATAVTCPVGSFVAKDPVSVVFRNLAGRLYDDERKLALSYEGFMTESYPEVLLVTTPTDIPIHTTSKGIHTFMEQNDIAHRYLSVKGEQHKLGHVFNVLHPEWKESVETNTAILEFFREHAK